VKLLVQLSREERAGPSLESETVPVSSQNFLEFFGLDSHRLPAVSIASALKVPAVTAAVMFLSRTMATLPKHVYRRTDSGPQRIKGKLQTTIHEAPNDEMGAAKFWQYFWQQVFTGGRGLAWIERSGGGVEALWLIDPSKATIKRTAGRLVYAFDGKTYPSADVIDVPFALREDQIRHYGPITLATKAIQLALAMNDYASTFFAGGGIPPLAMIGPVANTPAGLQRQMADVHRVIEAAKKSDRPVFPMPSGYELKPVGFDPEKGQMTDARRFQVEEIARAYQLPPVFLQDLTRATFTNAEQQDLHLVKHLIGQWVQALEDELNLKLFGRTNRNRYVEHNVDGLLRGDFKSRIDGIVRGIQGGLMEPNRGRALMNWPAHSNPAADDLFMQGATVPLGTLPAAHPVPPKSSTSNGSNGADDNDDEA
jgi:HK97 family phage portal protein